MSLHEKVGYVKRFRQSALIARYELKRRSRSARASVRLRVLWFSIVAFVSIVTGIGSYLIVIDISNNALIANAILGGGFVWIALYSATRAQRGFEQLNPSFLLTNVTGPSVILGYFLFLFAQAGRVVLGPIIAGSIGGSVGLSSLTALVWILISLTVLTVFAVVLGTTFRLGILLIGRKFAKAGYYRDLLIVFGWIPILLLLVLFGDELRSLVAVVGLIENTPLIFLEIVLLGAAIESLSTSRAAGLLVGIFCVLSVFGLVTVAISRRLWFEEVTPTAKSSRSASLMGNGVIGRLLGNWVPRPTVTVARHRWLQERRLFRGFFTVGFALVMLAFIIVPLGSVTNPIVLVAFALGTVIGIWICFDPIGYEYRTLPMILTSIPGSQFIGGFFLAALLPGMLIIGVSVTVLGLITPTTLPEIVGFILFGIVVCATTASVGIATGLRLNYYDFSPTPTFFTAAPVFVENWMSMARRLLLILIGGTIVALPGMLGTSLFVHGQGEILGIPENAIKTVALATTIILAIVVCNRTYQVATSRFNRYAPYTNT